MEFEKFHRLYNSVAIPSIGFGTWKIPNTPESADKLATAIKIGYRHVDTASMYGNEEMVGIAIKNSSVSREEIFVTTKLPNTVRGYEQTLESFNESLRKLSLDYVDLYLIHWPAPLAFRGNYKQLNIETWHAFEHLYKRGKVRAIGISNFLVHHIQELTPYVDVLPMVNQIEVHPYYYDKETIEYCKGQGMVIEAFSPLMRGRFAEKDELMMLAQRYNRTSAQISLRWLVQKGLVPLPKTLTPSRMEENLNIYDFAIKQEDMQLIDRLSESEGRIISHPDTAKY